MADLGMQQAVQELAVDEHAATDAGADGDVDERIGPLTRAPEEFAEHGGIHIGVPGDGDVVAVCSIGTMLVNCQPGFGVVVMKP
jgi:hypothetical protein